MSNHLAISVVPPEESEWGTPETRFLVDGIDVIAETFDKGPAADPDVLLGDGSPLLDPRVVPEQVRLAEAECTVGCCGALEVRVHRDGDQVVWSGWHNPDDEVVLGEFRFAADDYLAELGRARRERPWEWPGRIVARLIAELLRADPALLDRWDCGLDFASSPDARRPEVVVVFSSPPLTRVEAATVWTQYRIRFAVTDDPPPTQARAAIGMLAAGDPRRWGEICGGSA